MEARCRVALSPPLLLPRGVWRRCECGVVVAPQLGKQLLFNNSKRETHHPGNGFKKLCRRLKGSFKVETCVGACVFVFSVCNCCRCNLRALPAFAHPAAHPLPRPVVMHDHGGKSLRAVSRGGWLGVLRLGLPLSVADCCSVA